MKISCLRQTYFFPGLVWLLAWMALPQTVFAIRHLKVGDPMPDFSLPRADDDSISYKSEQLTGRPAAIIFWRKEQKLSLDAMQDLENIYREIGPARFGILAVETRRSSASEVQAALAEENLSYPVLLDPQRFLYEKVGLIVTPTTLLFDAQGALKFVVVSNPKQYQQIIRARLLFLLGEIDEQTMDQQLKPTVMTIEHDLAAAWRMFNLGKKLQYEGKSEQAVTVYEKAVAEHPSLAEARCALGFLKLETGAIEAAAQHFQSALSYQPNSPTAKLGQAAVMARSGQDLQAEQILLSLLSRNSDAVRVRYELGRIYHHRGELEKAVTFYQDAFSLVFPESEKTALPRSVSSMPAPTEPVPVSYQGSASPDTATATSPQTATTFVPAFPASDAQYVGIKRCKKCHLQQFKSWETTKMAQTFEVLKPGNALEEKQNRNIDPQKDYSSDPQCLQCHTTGFGRPGGYQIPTAGDDKAARLASEYAGIICEACHGPGSKYSPVHEEIQDNKRKYSSSELIKFGQYKLEEAICAVCHNENAPCIETGYVFDFEQRKEQGTHRHYKLQFRVP